MASKLWEDVEFHLAFKDLSSFMLAFSTCCSVLPISKRPQVKPNVGLLLYSSLFCWILTSQFQVALRIHFQAQCDCNKLAAVVFCLVYLSKLKRVVGGLPQRSSLLSWMLILQANIVWLLLLLLYICLCTAV